MSKPDIYEALGLVSEEREVRQHDIELPVVRVAPREQAPRRKLDPNAPVFVPRQMANREQRETSSVS